MIRPAAHALWRAAPRRLWRTPGWLLLVLVGATLLVASVVAPPLFVATARATALDSALGTVEGNPYGSDSADLRVTWDGVLPAVDEAYVRDRLDALDGYGAPQVSAAGVAQSRTMVPVAVFEGKRSRSVLWTGDGALEALGADPDARGVWLSQAVADELGAEVGDEVKIGLYATFFADKPTVGKTVLAGTYEPAPGTSLPAEIAALPDSERWFLPTNPDSPEVRTPLAIVDPATFGRLVLKVHETPFYAADLVLDRDIDPDVASALVPKLQRLGDDAYDPSTRLSAHLRQGLPFGAQLELATGLPDLVLAADHTADSARDQVRAYAVGGQVLAAVLLVAAWVLLGRSRRREQLLVSGLGLRPVEIAALSLLEVLPVCVLAVPAGLGLAGLGLVLAGPPTDAGLSFVSADLVRALLAALAAVVLIGGTSGLAAAGTDRVDRLSRLGRGRRAVPGGVALLLATGVVAFAVLSVEVQDRSGAPLTMVFPVLVAASVALVVARLAGWARVRRPGRARPGTPRWLATRRTGPVVREVTALTVVIAIALGLFAYSLTVRRGVDDGVADKTAALSGAPTSLSVADDFRGKKMAGAVTPPVEGSTIVWRRPVSLPPDFGDRPLMTVDPESFADVADWGASGDLDAGRRLLPELDEKAKGIPVIISGDTDLERGDTGSLDFSSELTVPFFVVGVVPAFPGSETETSDVTVIAGTRLLFKVLPPTIDPRLKTATSTKAGALTSWVWSDSSAPDLRAALADEGIATDGALVTATQQRIDAGLVASTWAAAYVLALGVVILVLALAGALVLALRLADRDTVSDVLLQRMGYSSRDLARSRVWEVAYAVATALSAAVLAAAVLVLAPTTIDAAAAIPPLTRPRTGVADAVVLALVLAAMVLLAWVIGTWRARRRVAAEVLRAGA